MCHHNLCGAVALKDSSPQMHAYSVALQRRLMYRGRYCLCRIMHISSMKDCRRRMRRRLVYDWGLYRNPDMSRESLMSEVRFWLHLGGAWAASLHRAPSALAKPKRDFLSVLLNMWHSLLVFIVAITQFTLHSITLRLPRSHSSAWIDPWRRAV
jgi:hypothetical protein